MRNILIAVCLLSVTAATALLLRVRAQVNRIAERNQRWHQANSRYYHERRFCQTHNRDLTRDG